MTPLRSEKLDVLLIKILSKSLSAARIEVRAIINSQRCCMDLMTRGQQNGQRNKTSGVEKKEEEESTAKTSLL
jgi:hypothetical protein